MKLHAEKRTKHLRRQYAINEKVLKSNIAVVFGIFSSLGKKCVEASTVNDKMLLNMTSL